MPCRALHGRIHYYMRDNPIQPDISALAINQGSRPVRRSASVALAHSMRSSVFMILHEGR